MNKIKLEEIENYNENLIKNYLSKNQKGGCLNEYFYAQDKEVIIDLMENIKYKNIKDNSIFLTNFFWNHKPGEYQLAENCGNFFLRLEGFKDNNNMIEVKELVLLEKINYLDNLDYICNNNNELKKMFQLENTTLSKKMINLVNNKDNLNKINVLYCDDWIEKKDMHNLIQDGIKYIESLEFMRKLDNQFPAKKIIKIKKI